MIHLKKSHKSAYLKDEILKCLRSYNIEISQIYSSTNDNGANVVKVGKLLQELQEEELDVVGLEDEDSDENIHNSLSSVISVVRCAAHTIQLAAYDVIKLWDTDLIECRSVVKKLRTIVRSGDVEQPMPVLDNATRWNSSYDMINSLKNMKAFIDDNFIENPLEVNWSFVDEFVASFAPLAKCTKRLQKEQYILGDLYRDWLSCEMDLADLSSMTISVELLRAMQKRKQLLLENYAFASAIYLDPRFNFLNTSMLSEEQKDRALTHLVKTFEVMQNLEKSSETSSQSETIAPEENVPTTSSFAYAKLTQFIINSAAVNPRIEETRTFRQKIILLSNSTMVPLETDMLQYWKVTPLDPDILRVLCVALAVPATQVSVERSFSALALTLTKLRSKLSNNTINNLLITKLNFSELACNVLNFTDSATES